MKFLLGASCWHVFGYLNGLPNGGRLLCGWRGDEFGIGGNAVDVIASEMPLCKSCDGATGGEASRYVDRVVDGARDAEGVAASAATETAESGEALGAPISVEGEK